MMNNSMNLYDIFVTITFVKGKLLIFDIKTYFSKLVCGISNVLHMNIYKF